MDVSTLNDTNVYEFIPQSPLEFQEGDIFGVHIPRRGRSKLRLREQRGSGPINLFDRRPWPLSTIRTGALRTDSNDFPLVTAEISKNITYNYIIEIIAIIQVSLHLQLPYQLPIVLILLLLLFVSFIICLDNLPVLFHIPVASEDTTIFTLNIYTNTTADGLITSTNTMALFTSSIK